MKYKKKFKYGFIPIYILIIMTDQNKYVRFQSSIENRRLNKTELWLSQQFVKKIISFITAKVV